MASSFFQGAYWLGVILASVIRVVYTRGYREMKIAEYHGTRLDLLLTAVPALGMFVLPLIYVLTPWLDFADYHLPMWAGWIGVALFGAGLWLLWRSHADLARNWSPSLEIIEGHSLVTHGVFRYIRHPMYAAHVLWGIAQVFLLQNWIAGFSMLVCLLPQLVNRIRGEEQMMLEHFGEEYRSYMDRTGRLIPRFWG